MRVKDLCHAMKASGLTASAQGGRRQPCSLLNADELEILAPFLPDLDRDYGESFWQGARPREEELLAGWRYQRLTPLLYQQVRRHGWQKAMSARFLENLMGDYARSLKAASRQERELGELVAGLQQRGIEAVLLKGADLRHRLYGDPGVRPMADADLFISPEALSLARSFFSELGYGLGLEGPTDATRLKENFGNELFFRAPWGKVLNVDLHWEIEAAARLYRIPYTSIRPYLQKCNYGGSTVQVLSTEHLVINLCLHLLSHWPMGPWRRSPLVLQIVDLLWALDCLGPDWPSFLAEAERLRCSFPVYCIFQEISALAPRLIPDEIMAALGAFSTLWYEGPVLSLWHGLGRIYHYYPGMENFVPRFAPLRRLWTRTLI